MLHKHTKASYRHAFTIDSFLNFATQLSLFALSFISTLIIARALGPKGKGLYSLVILIPTLLANFLNMGINFSNIYLIGQRKYEVNRIVGSTISLSFLLGVSATVILLLLIIFTDNTFFTPTYNKYLYLTMPIIPLILVLDNIYSTLLGHRNIVKLSAVRLLKSLIYVVILLLLVYFFTISVYSAIFANMSGLFAAIIIGIYFLIKSRYFTGLVLDNGIIKEMLNFGYKQHLGSICQILNYRIDMLIIVYLLTATDLGLYSIAVVVAEMIWYLPNSIGQVLYAKVASESDKLPSSFTPLVCRTVILIIFTGCLILYALSDVVIPYLFTPRFTASVAALKLLLPGVIFLSVSKILGSHLTGLGFPQYSSVASAISLVATIVFDFLLIPFFGINGAALASSISYMVNALVILYFFKATSGIALIDTLFIKLSDFLEYKRIFLSLRASS